MRRALISCAVVVLALLAQLTIVNRLALPGGAGPDLVLLAVVALALTGGPLPGMLTGFLAGLALDVAPPASHTIGQYALVFCLVGYGCGRLAALGEASPTLYVGISAAAAAVGAALHAVLGVMLSDPEVTWPAVRHVLPPSLIYDVILSPFVLYAVVRLNAWAGRAAGPEGAPAAAGASAGWAASAIGAAGLTAGAVRQASTSGSPRLHLGDHRGSDAWIGSARTAGATRLTGLAGPAGRRPGTREPKLRFSGLHGSGGGPAPGGGSHGAAGARYTGSKSAPKMNFSTAGHRDGLAGRGSGPAARSSAVPRFRKRSSVATLGTGGSLSRSTPRRGTFGRSRSFGRRQSFGASSAGGRSMGSRSFGKRRSFGASSLGGRSVGGRSSGRRSSAPRLRMGRVTLRARIWRLIGRKTGGYR